ncbi:MAG: hypothetical protein R3F39_18940 [Myxococcota bacterium]
MTPTLRLIALALAPALLAGVAGCTSFVPLDQADDGGLRELPLSEVTILDALGDGGADAADDSPEIPDGTEGFDADADAALEVDGDLPTDAALEVEPDAVTDAGPDLDLGEDLGLAHDLPPDADADADATTEPDADADAEPDLGPDATPDADATPDTIVAPPDPCAPGRVTLGSSGFRLNGAAWHPRMVGYAVEVRRPSAAGPEPWFIAPHWDSCDDGVCCSDTVSCLARIGDDLDLAVLMGFNAVRLTGLDFHHPAGASLLGCVRLSAQGALESCAALDFAVPAEREASVELIAGVVELAKARKLKVMLAAGRADFSEPAETSAHKSLLTVLATEFAHESALFAYEVVEAVPQPTPPLLLTAATTRTVMSSWYQAIRATGAPQLVTLGLGDSGASVSFDAATLPVDFLGYHPHPLGGFDAVRETTYAAELTWLAATGRPWMVTATGFASGAWGTESEQVAFAQKSMVAARNCGALGYGWGQLRDTTSATLGGLGAVKLDSSLKPVAGIFKAIDLATADAACPAAPVALNYSGPTAFQVSGRLIDAAGKAVPFARVTGWTCPVYAERFHTFSGPDGKFTLRSPTGLVQVAISGPGKTPVTNIQPKCLTKNVGDTFITASGGVLSVSTPSCP